MTPIKCTFHDSDQKRVQEVGGRGRHFDAVEGHALALVDGDGVREAQRDLRAFGHHLRGARASRVMRGARRARGPPALGGGGCARHLPSDLDRKVLLAHHPRERRHPVPALPQHHLPRRARPRGSARRAALAAGRGGADRVRLDFGGFVVGNLLEALHLRRARWCSRVGAWCSRGTRRGPGGRGAGSSTFMKVEVLRPSLNGGGRTTPRAPLMRPIIPPSRFLSSITCPPAASLLTLYKLAAPLSSPLRDASPSGRKETTRDAGAAAGRGALGAGAPGRLS